MNDRCEAMCLDVAIDLHIHVYFEFFYRSNYNKEAYGLPLAVCNRNQSLKLLLVQVGLRFDSMESLTPDSGFVLMFYAGVKVRAI